MDKDNSLAVWVTTMNPLTFWDPVTGLAYSQTNSKLPFRAVGCCFNDIAFYANVQVADAACELNFDFADEKAWKGMSADAISSCKSKKTASFSFRDISASVSEDEVRDAIRQRVKAYRADHGLSWAEDEELGYLVPQLLEKSELEKVYGVKMPVGPGGDFFSSGIKKMIPKGHTFKGIFHFMF
jgi:hypothetical protein